ncbi:hypothetical protein ABIC45_002933 [Mucilaginibacter rubeus]|uniref:hypothetical protein n=1 Tax=Mucilaginibacter rubeus TaxID=2027860 RepID=UPI0033993CD8
MKGSQNMARKLPEFTIAGTLYTVDARIYEFRETAEPWNRISMDDFWEESPTHILFDRQAKNIYTGAMHISDRPAHVEIVVVPPLIELDPVGLARRYNLADDALIPQEKRAKILADQLIGLQQNTRQTKKGKEIR